MQGIIVWCRNKEGTSGKTKTDVTTMCISHHLGTPSRIRCTSHHLRISSCHKCASHQSTHSCLRCTTNYPGTTSCRRCTSQLCTLHHITQRHLVDIGVQHHLSTPSCHILYITLRNRLFWHFNMALGTTNIMS